MANWTGVITNSGSDLLNGWIEGKIFHFERAECGAGNVETAALMAQTDIASHKQVASILKAESVGGGIRIKLQITAPEEGYLLSQIGVWASIDGVTALLAIYQHDKGVPIPSSEESADFVFTFYALIATSNKGEWTVNVDTSAIASVSDLHEAITEAGKKYLQLDGSSAMTGDLSMGGKKVTGLAEPENETDAATKKYVDGISPEYSAASTLGYLVSGEKLNAAFGKIAKGISDLIAHIANKKNPHGVSADQLVSGTLSPDRLPTVPISKGGFGGTTAAEALANIGAAESSHKHSAGDINSGTLASSRLPTVPISKGGTAATTAAGARGNLGTMAVTAIYNVGLDFTDGVTTYANSAITTSSVCFVQWRAGAVSTLTDSVLSTTSQDGKILIIAKSGKTGTALPVNILILNP